MKKKFFLLLLFCILVLNISAVSSSWLDGSRYETGGYSFKIPEGFHFTYGPGSDEGEYLVDEAGGAYTDFGSNRISIIVSNMSNNDNNQLIYTHNNTLNFYNNGNSTIGVYETDNGTFITIIIYCWQDRYYDNERAEQDINILLGMFESIKED